MASFAIKTKSIICLSFTQAPCAPYGVDPLIKALDNHYYFLILLLVLAKTPFNSLHKLIQYQNKSM